MRHEYDVEGDVEEHPVECVGEEEVVQVIKVMKNEKSFWTFRLLYCWWS